MARMQLGRWLTGRGRSRGWTRRWAADMGEPAADPFTPDVFGLPPISDIPDDVARGLKTLAGSAPLWPVDINKWRAAVAAVQAFSAVFDARARAHGWTSAGLDGLSRLAPWSDVSRMGAPGSWHGAVTESSVSTATGSC
jgi:hypothetical protein